MRYGNLQDQELRLQEGYTMINRRGILIIFMLLGLAVKVHGQDYSLWYRQPARNWNEALPVGNGRLGAMVFGGVKTERLQLNEETVWTIGGRFKDKKDGHKAIPRIQELIFAGKYAEAERLCRERILSDRHENASTYQTLGDLLIRFEGLDEYSDYYRDLQLDQAIAETRFISGEATHSRRVFASAVDQALVLMAEANRPGQINCTIEISRPGEGEIVAAHEDILLMRQHINNGNGVRYEVQVKVIPTGGELITHDSRIVVRDADKLELRLVAATDYRRDDPAELCSAHLRLSERKDFEAMLQDHTRNHGELYNRVKINLPSSKASLLPTDERMEAQKEGKSDPQLAALYFQFGRYLLISSSRPGWRPANLQGIWNESLNPPWFCDYHININAQMNYWPAEVGNLSELHVPFLGYIGRLRERGRKTANEVYGVNGFVAHHRSDVWHFTSPNGDPHYGMWPMGAAWASTHFWEHYQFGGDEEYLRNVGYPIMREAAQFLSEFMVKHPSTGKWVIGPSISPENMYLTPDKQRGSVVLGASMDLQIIHHLFSSCIEASILLDNDEIFRNQLKDQLNDLTPVPIGKDGRILEWSDENLAEADPGHRHMSHLYGLFPSNEYNWSDKPAYMKAAEKVIEVRLQHGAGHTGWSRAWMVNLYARLLQPEKAWQNLTDLWKQSTRPNLFNDHPPFQIDGNFGATAAIAEMLVQSHTGEITLLPSLPPELADGEVSGLIARGGFEVAMTWSNGRLNTVGLTSLRGNPYMVNYEGKTIQLSLNKGEFIQLDGNLEIVSQ